jgi:nucleoside-diphosphate-sugar epimerase
LVFENFENGKRAQWIANDRVKHSFTYTPDAGRATALLGNTESAYNQVWHLPTDRDALTGKEFIERTAKALGVEPRYSVLPKWMIRAAGIFNPLIRENAEMLYQNDSEYLFDSSKFDGAFEFETTPYERGIRESLELPA